MTSVKARSVQELRLGLLEKAIELLGRSQEDINKTLQSIQLTLANYSDTKAALDRAFGEVKKVDDRLDKIEKDMPLLKLTSSWVKSAVLGIAALLGLAIWKLIIGG